MIVLGINTHHGDASAAVVVDGALVAAAEEERFNRFKHSAGVPVAAVRYCVDAAGATTVADTCVIVPTVSPERVTLHTEAFQSVVWPLLVSHPLVTVAEIRWESTR